MVISSGAMQFMPILLAVLRPSLFGFFFTGSDACLLDWSEFLESMIVRDENAVVATAKKVNKHTVWHATELKVSDSLPS